MTYILLPQLAIKFNHSKLLNLCLIDDGLNVVKVIKCLLKNKH